MLCIANDGFIFPLFFLRHDELLLYKWKTVCFSLFCSPVACSCAHGGSICVCVQSIPVLQTVVWATKLKCCVCMQSTHDIMRSVTNRVLYFVYFICFVFSSTILFHFSYFSHSSLGCLFDFIWFPWIREQKCARTVFSFISCSSHFVKHKQ